MRPIGGRCKPRADFEQTVLAHDPSITPAQLAKAIAAGDHFFATSSSTPEYNAHHRVMLRQLRVEASSQLLAELRREVPPAVFLETYPDVEETLEELSQRGVRMAVVSDAWRGQARRVRASDAGLIRPPEIATPDVLSVAAAFLVGPVRAGAHRAWRGSSQWCT
jgi:phosphoglycolate phosphatase-like HAD superfamily hydrolase